MRRAAELTLILALAGAVWLACSVTDIHAFIAGQYEPKLDCVTYGFAVDVLNGADPNTSCDAACVVLPFDGGTYVTGACPPFPEGDDVSGRGALCVKALAAIHRGDFCADGGPSNPLVDAGGDAGGAGEGGQADASPKDAAAKADAGAIRDAGAQRDAG